ncbi:unnamed protein product, partial [Oncorhynchus mykiss]
LFFFFSLSLVSAVKPTAAAPPAAAHGARTESTVKINRMRLRIAQRLKEGSADSCHAHHLQRDRHEQHPEDEEAP